jgi:chromosome segregation ATPase
MSTPEEENSLKLRIRALEDAIGTLTKEHNSLRRQLYALEEKRQPDKRRCSTCHQLRALDDMYWPQSERFATSQCNSCCSD